MCKIEGRRKEAKGFHKYRKNAKTLGVVQSTPPHYILFTLHSFCFGLYAKDIFLGLTVCKRAKTCYTLARNLALLAILISI